MRDCKGDLSAVYSGILTVRSVIMAVLIVNLFYLARCCYSIGTKGMTRNFIPLRVDKPFSYVTAGFFC